MNKISMILVSLVAISTQFAEAQSVPQGDDARIVCEDHLRKAICVTNASHEDIDEGVAAPLPDDPDGNSPVNPVTIEDASKITDPAKFWRNIKCGNDPSDNILRQMMTIYDNMPPEIWPILCTLDRVFVSGNLDTHVAFAGSHGPKGVVPKFTYIGIRPDIFTLQTPLTIDQVATWKEQTSFGLEGWKNPFPNPLPSLVQLHYGLDVPNSALFYTLMHEFGHLIDAENFITSNCKNNDCAWQRYSWQPGKDGAWTILPSASFLHQSDFCGVTGGCVPIATDQAFAIYENLRKSAFVTTYASQGPDEDFAENWAWYIIHNFKNANYIIKVPGEHGGEVNMNQAFDGDTLIAKKQAFIKKLWNSRLRLEPDNAHQ